MYCGSCFHRCHPQLLDPIAPAPGSIEQTKMTHFLLGKKHKERKGRGQMDKLSKDALTPLVTCFSPAKPYLLRVHSALS